MKQFFVTMLGVFAGLIVFFVILPIGLLLLLAAIASAQPSVPARTVLELDLRQTITDQTPSNPFAAFGGTGLSTVQIVDTLAQAEDDDGVRVLLLRLPEAGLSPAVADEVRQAVHRFRASGKRVIAHSQGLAAAGPVVSSYMVGAAADEFWMQEIARFEATGLAADTLFLGRALERFGVEAEFEQRYEYKSAVETFTASDFTPAHREAALAWMGSIHDAAIGNAARDRGVAAPALRQTLEAGPYSAAQALQAGLIDRLGDVGEVQAAAKALAGDDAEIVTLADYAGARGPRTGSGRDVIAIVSAEGAILTGTESTGFGAGSSIASDTTAQAILDAAENDSVRAIVFRVSSPGGSPAASEQILNAVRAARAAGKPVVVSMGDYAASGGYWVSSEADWIVAQPSTITGSIGVYGGKFVIDDALARFGVDVRGLTVGGDYTGALSATRNFTADQRAAFAAAMDQTYEDFIVRVARGRNLPAERVREIARGRVWTGAQARQLGLVDQLGGLHEAIARAKLLADIPADRSVRLRRYPAPQGPFEALAAAFGVSSQAAVGLVTVGRLASDPTLRAVTEPLGRARLREQGATVLAEPADLTRP